MLNYSVQVGQLEDESPRLSTLGGKVTSNPFPGLRPFSLDECHLFFGRENHVDDILLKLSQNRSVAVMGYSGSGKSSLMYCGLVPMLYGGFMTESGSSWKVIIARPGNSPIQNLTDSIVSLLVQDGSLRLSDSARCRTRQSSVD